MSSPLSQLGLTGIPPVTHEPNRSSTGFLGIIDQKTDTQAPNRKRASHSPSFRPLPLPQDTLHPDKQVLFKSTSSQSTIRTSTAQSTLSTTGRTRKLRIRLFGNKRSQTTPDTSPGINSDSSLSGTSSRKIATPQPTRSVTLVIDLPQSRNWEPVSPVVLRSMEMAASDSESLLRPARDGTVSAGNLEGLVSRVITDIGNPSRNDRFSATFLTIYQLFATNERLFGILKRRFESSELDPVASRSRYP